MRVELFRSGSIASALVLALAVDGAAQEPSGAPPLFELRLVREAPAPGREEVTLDGEILYLEPQAILDDGGIESARAEIGPQGLIVDMVFTPEAGRHLGDVTEREIGNRMAIVVDGAPMSAPWIRDRIGPRPGDGGTSRASVYLSVTGEEAEALAARFAERWPSP